MIAHSAYPAEPWSLHETELDLNVLDSAGSLFALPNGHIGAARKPRRGRVTGSGSPRVEAGQAER